MDEPISPPPIHSPLLDGKLWKIILAPLGVFALGALFINSVQGLGISLVSIAAIAMLVSSVWAARLIALKVGRTPGSQFGWGLLTFCILQFFYIGCCVVGCTAALALQ